MSKDRPELSKEEKALQHKYSGWPAPEHEQDAPRPAKVKKHKPAEPKDEDGDGH